MELIDDVNKTLRGLDMHKAWENLIIQIGGTELSSRHTLDE